MSGVQHRFRNSKVEELDSGAESLSQLLEAHLWAFEGINSRPPLVRGNQGFVPVARKNCFRVFLGQLAGCQRGKDGKPLVK